MFNIRFPLCTAILSIQKQPFEQTYGHMNRCESWLWRLGATVVFIFLQKVWQQWQDLIGKLRMSGISLGKTWCWFNWVQPPMIKRLLFWNCSFHTSPFKELLAQAAWICASHFSVYIYIYISECNMTQICISPAQFVWISWHPSVSSQSSADAPVLSRVQTHRSYVWVRVFSKRVHTNIPS